MIRVKLSGAITVGKAVGERKWFTMGTTYGIGIGMGKANTILRLPLSFRRSAKAPNFFIFIILRRDKACVVEEVEKESKQKATRAHSANKV